MALESSMTRQCARRPLNGESQWRRHVNPQQRQGMIPSMPRFVLLYHECPAKYARASHWDLMLEVGESLRTWALLSCPTTGAAAQSYTASLFPACAAASTENIVGAEPLGDHRRDYLEYEGPVSGQRGRVHAHRRRKLPNAQRVTAMLEV